MGAQHHSVIDITGHYLKCLGFMHCRIFCLLFAVDCIVPPSRVRVIASPAQLQVREGMEATFVCHVEGDARTRLVWSRLPQVTRLFFYVPYFVVGLNVLEQFIFFFIYTQHFCKYTKSILTVDRLSTCLEAPRIQRPHVNLYTCSL